MVHKDLPPQALDRCEGAIIKGDLLKIIPMSHRKGSGYLMHVLHSKTWGWPTVRTCVSHSADPNSEKWPHMQKPEVWGS